MLPYRDLFIWLTMYLSEDKEKFLEPLPLEKDLLITVGVFGGNTGVCEAKQREREKGKKLGHYFLEK